jgi:ubiquinone/menaquinone biosynthesis C-methylase UbiE
VANGQATARQSAERFDPSAMTGLIAAEHLARYHWAAQALEGQTVLDAGCGVGYGSLLLARAGATRVVGCDISPEAVAQARDACGERVEFVVGDLRDLPFEADSFEAVVCFEAIEHIGEHDAALDEFARVLRPGGLLFVSSPNRDVYTPGNPHHVAEYVPAELDADLRRRFTHVRLFRQHPWLASLVTDDEGFATSDPGVDLGAWVGKNDRASGGEEVYTVAAASDGPLPDLRRLAVLSGTADMKAWQERVSALEHALQQRFSRRLVNRAGRELRRLRRGSSA